MISLEILRRYPFFGSLDDTQLNAIARITEEEHLKKGITLFEENKPADTLYFLLEGSIALYYISEEKYHPKSRKEFLVDEINPGEIFAISAVIEPYLYTSTARVDKPGRVLKIQAGALRELLDTQNEIGYKLMRQVASAALERLTSARANLVGCSTD